MAIGYLIFGHILPIVLFLIVGIFLIIKSKTMVRHGKLIKSIGCIFVVIGIIFIISEILFFQITSSNTRIDIEVTFNGIDYILGEEDIGFIHPQFPGYDDVTILLNGDDQNLIYLSFAPDTIHNLDINAFFQENNTIQPYNFIQNTNETTIIFTRDDNNIEIVFSEPVTSCIYGEYTDTWILNNERDVDMFTFDGNDKLRVNFRYEFNE